MVTLVCGSYLSLSSCSAAAATAAPAEIAAAAAAAAPVTTAATTTAAAKFQWRGAPKGASSSFPQLLDKPL